jgi:hypothetical protein
MTVLGWNAFVSEIVTTGLSLIKIGLTFAAQDLSDDMIKGINALRCVFTSGFEDTWLLLASLYYAALQFNQESQIADLINQAYPYVCSCKYETNEWNNWIQSSGGSSGSTIAAKFAYCSEAAKTAADSFTTSS